MTRYTVAQVQAMTDLEVLGTRKWPAFFTEDQMRAQLLHEAKGYPLPFPGAVWREGVYVAAAAADHPAALLADTLGLRLSISLDGSRSYCRRVGSDSVYGGFATAEAAVRDYQAGRRLAAIVKHFDWLALQKRLPERLYWRRFNYERTKQAVWKDPDSEQTTALLACWPPRVQRALRRRFDRPESRLPAARPLTLVWRDENYGRVYRAKAFRPGGDQLDLPDETRERLARLYGRHGFEFNHGRAAWIAEYCEDQAILDLVAALTAEGFAVKHTGAVPALLRPAEEPAAARG